MKKLILAAVLSVAAFAQAVTVKDAKGDFTIDTVPKRIVALEYSFVDALDNVGVIPVGIADDNDPKRLIEPLHSHVEGKYTSVGTRSQPSLEAISALKPDLIIADLDRHDAVYADLQKIAPTLILNSRKGTYPEILEQAKEIADVVGKHDEMAEKITALHKAVADAKTKLPQNQLIVFGNSRENDFTMYSADSFPGGILAELGAKLPDLQGKAYAATGFEQVVALQPDWVIVAHYRGKDGESIVNKWEKDALWQTIPAVQKGQVGEVEPNVWARSRGLYAVEAILHDVLKIMDKK